MPLPLGKSFAIQEDFFSPWGGRKKQTKGKNQML
jgi:hypothetical protein